MSGVPVRNFQDLILRLSQFWADQGCVLHQGYDLEVGAGTFHPATFLRVFGPKPWRTALVQPSRRPKDGRYGENPNRLQHYYQFQVILKPAPDDVLEIYLAMLAAIGIDPIEHDIRFVEDDWESPTLGASGLGWEVWCDGMEITQFTYFQQVGGIELRPISAEITLGLERIAMYLQKKDWFHQIEWTDGVAYGDIHMRTEIEFSRFNFELADVELARQCFAGFETEAKKLLGSDAVLPAYDHTLKCSHMFNMLDARGALSVSERTAMIGRVRTLAKACAHAYVAKYCAPSEPAAEPAP